MDVVVGLLGAGRWVGMFSDTIVGATDYEFGVFHPEKITA